MKKNISVSLGVIVIVVNVTVLAWAVFFSAVMAQEKKAANPDKGVAEVSADGTSPKPVELNADNMEYKATEGKFVATGHVVLKKEGSVLTCDSLEFFREKSEANAQGNVVLLTPKGTVWADTAFYNFNLKKGEFTHARIMAYPMFGEAETISKIREDYYVMSNGYLTTSDYDNPEWRIRSRHIELYPGLKAVAHDSTMFVGGTPIMYWPKYTQDLRENRPHVSVIPGYSKRFGAYVLTTYRTQLTPHIGTTYHLDYRERKDVAWGVDVEYQPPGMGKGLIKTYYMNERNISADHVWQDRPTPTVERERYRIEWRHKWDVDPATSAILQYYKLSDADILKDYFEKEFRQDTTPPTFFLLTHTMPNSSLTLRTDVRVNRFESTVERLPEVNFSLNNQQIGDTGFYFKSSNTASNLVKKDPSPSDVRNGTVRLDTDDELSRPFKLGFLELRPHVGTEQTYYSRALDRQDYESIRGQFKTGMDASTKFYKIYDVSFDKWGIEVNRLRHVITPTISYNYQSDPTFRSAKLFQFDEMDNRNRANNFGLGLENKLQTKRNGVAVDLFRSLLTSTYRLSGNNSLGSFGDVTLDNELYPNGHVTFHTDATYDNDIGCLRTFNFDLYLRDLKRWEWDLSRRWTRNDDDIITSQLSYKFNPKWRAVIYERFNADNAQWQEQQYAFVRDLHSWEVEFAYNEKHGSDDAGSEVWVIFRLKAFPSVAFNGGSGFNRRKAGSQSY
jgi:lipopolysaccharide assembly outer membrane protein LptD (OstA)